MIAAVGAGQLLAWASSYYLLAILARPMALGLGLPPALVYLAFSGALLTAALLGPVAGGFVDRHGGRRVLLASNGLFALGLLCLALAQGAAGLVLGWLLIGAAMPFGLYDAAFSTLVALYREQARRPIVGVTLIAGFASSVSWPLTAMLEAQLGWRGACAAWALLHLTAGVYIHHRLVPEARADHPLHAGTGTAAPSANAPPAATLWIMAGVFLCSGFVFAAMATHLPRVLQAAGCAPAAAVAAAALVGVAQVAARLAEAGILHRLHPLISARIALALHPLGVVLLAAFGAPLAVPFTLLHGAGIGLMTIVKGTLPLTLFGPAGFGRRSGILEAPARLAQAVAPLAFGLALDTLGARALWISGAFGLAGFAAALYLHARTPARRPAAGV